MLRIFKSAFNLNLTTVGNLTDVFKNFIVEFTGVKQFCKSYLPTLALDIYELIRII